jgi:hypothetical protein
LAIQVRDSAEFQRLLVALSQELVEANIFFRMHMDLIAASTEYADEMNQSVTFWDRTITAHLDAAILRLCRIYDQEKRNLSLSGLLDTIRANPHLFSAQQFERRIEGNPAAQLLNADPPVLDRAILDKDISYVTRATNPIVDRLIDVRHNYYSHRNAADVVAERRVADEHPITRDDVGEMLRGGMEIANRYNEIFRAHFYSTQMVGADDYKSVLKAVRKRIAAQRQALEEECRRFGLDPGDV